MRRALAILSVRCTIAPALATLAGGLSRAGGSDRPPQPDRRARRRPRGRRIAVLLAVAAAALGAGSAWAFLSAGTAPDAAAQGVAASLDQVTGLALAAGGVTPTADPDVALAWNPALLSNGHSIDGYLVRRYTGSMPTAVCASDPTPIGPAHCTDADVPDGTYTYGVSARFESWTGPESAQIDVTVDTSAPSIDTSPSNPSANTSPTFTFSHASYSTFKCRLDDATDFTPCTSGDALSDLSDGPHTFRVEALDAHGNATQVAAYDWTIDTSPPSLDSTPSNPSANTAPAFAFSDPSYSDFKCSLDGADFAPCTSAAPLSAGNGSHTFDVEAVGADGVATTAAVYPWTVDATAPTISTEPSSHSANLNPSFSFSHAQSAYTFECARDGGAYGPCTSPTAYTGLSDGSYEFDVAAVSADGAVTPPAVHTWTVDTSAPTITPTNAMVDGGTYASQSAGFTLSHAVYTSFQCFLDGGSFATCAGGGGAPAGLWPSTYQASPTNCGSFGQDANSFCTIDDSGSVELGVKFRSSHPVSIVGVRIYRVDAGPVTASLWDSAGDRLAGPTAFDGTATHGWQDVMFGSPVAITPGETYTASYFAPNADYPFEWFFFQNSSFTVGPITALQSGVDGGNGVYCYAGASCFPTDSFQDTNYWVTPLWVDGPGGPVQYGSLADGSHTITATAVDDDGHTTNNATFSWTVEHAAPAITSHPDATTGSTDADFSFSEPPYSHFECRLDAGSFVPCDGGTASYAGLDGSGAAGTTHTFTVHAVDSLGATTDDQTFTWVVDTTAPTVDVERAAEQSDSAGSLPIHFTATFDEPVHSFTGGVTLGGTADTSGATVTVTQTSPSVYDIAVSGAVGPGTVTASLDAGATTDLAGNASTASTSSGDDTVTYTP